MIFWCTTSPGVRAAALSLGLLSVGCLDVHVIDDLTCAARCDDQNDCTDDSCAGDVCHHFQKADGLRCENGICLGGICAAPGTVCLDPRTLSFEDVFPFDQRTLELTIAECGRTGPVQIAALALSGQGQEFELRWPALPRLLRSGESMTLEVTYRPTDFGTDRAVLEILGEAENGDFFSVPILGNTPAPGCDLRVSPTALDFGTLKVGESAWLDVSVQNAVSEAQIDCFIESVELSSPAGVPPDFAFDPPLSPKWRLGPGEQASFRVRFTPAGLGDHHAALWIRAPSAKAFHQGDLEPLCARPDFGGPPVAGQGCLPLIGRGQGASLQPMPRRIDAGSVRVDCTSSVLPLSVANLGSEAAEVGVLRLGGQAGRAFELAVRDWPRTVAPGGSLELELLYRPTSLATDEARLGLHADGSTPPLAVVPLLGQGSDQTLVREEFRAAVPVDVLFVIDPSAGSLPAREALAAGLETFLAPARTAQVDFHLGLASASAPRLTGFEQRLGALVHAPLHPPFLRADTPDLAAAFAANLAAMPVADGAQGLLATIAALTPPISQEENAGFAREDARLAIVFLSRLEDASSLDGSAALDPALVARFLSSLKPRSPDSIALAAIVGIGGSCDPALAEDCARTIQAVSLLRGRSVSICGDWSLDRLGTEIFGPRRVFALREIPWPPTMNVAVDGQLISGWSYLVDRNAVAIDFPPQAEVAITYTVACLSGSLP